MPVVVRVVLLQSSVLFAIPTMGTARVAEGTIVGINVVAVVVVVVAGRVVVTSGTPEASELVRDPNCVVVVAAC